MSYETYVMYIVKIEVPFVSYSYLQLQGKTDSIYCDLGQTTWTLATSV